MSDSMIERVAKAIYRAMPKTYESSGEWLNLHPALQAGYMAVARAAIEAMREPTTSMLSDGVVAYASSLSGVTGNPADGVVNGRDIMATWQAMVDDASESKIRKFEGDRPAPDDTGPIPIYSGRSAKGPLKE